MSLKFNLISISNIIQILVEGNLNRYETSEQRSGRIANHAYEQFSVIIRAKPIYLLANYFARRVSRKSVTVALVGGKIPRQLDNRNRFILSRLASRVTQTRAVHNVNFGESNRALLFVGNYGNPKP